MSTRVNIDGRIVCPDEARISIFDHAFLYGDSIYESFRTYRQRVILFERNFARLERAARSVRLRLPSTEAQLKARVYETLREADNTEALVRIIVTRGVGELTPDPTNCRSPSILIIVVPLSAPAEDLYREGVAVVFSALKRDAHIASIKTGNLIHQVLGIEEAKSRDASEAIFLTPDGFVSDGTRSNIYFVNDGTVRTPSTDVGIVAGITRSLVLEVARKVEVDVVEGHFTPSDVQDAVEAFITSTTRGILPVTRLNGRQVGNGRVGPVTRRLMKAFREAVDVLAEGESVS